MGPTCDLGLLYHNVAVAAHSSWLHASNSEALFQSVASYPVVTDRSESLWKQYCSASASDARIPRARQAGILSTVHARSSLYASVQLQCLLCAGLSRFKGPRTPRSRRVKRRKSALEGRGEQMGDTDGTVRRNPRCSRKAQQQGIAGNAGAEQANWHTASG